MAHMEIYTGMGMNMGTTTPRRVLVFSSGAFVAPLEGIEWIYI